MTKTSYGTSSFRPEESLGGGNKSEQVRNFVGANMFALIPGFATTPTA